MPSDHSPGGDAKFQHVADVLRMEISDGVYPVGQRIPTQQELQERFEVSRDTVRRALFELRNDGWIESKQGSGTTVRPKEHWQRPVIPAPTAAMVHLKPYIDAAFEAPVVTLDLMTLTAASMDAHIRSQTIRVHNGEIRPRRIAVRLLLPSVDTHLVLPRSVADPTDPRPRERHHRLTARHAGSLYDALVDMEHQGLVNDVSVEIRTLAVTPIAKLYILNGTEALFGWYRVVQRPVDVPARDGGGVEKIEIYDVLGTGATLFPFAASCQEPQPLESIFVSQCQRWFDSVWNHLAQEATFGV
ncbi:winged helix-turn-helix domain-containing protein [Streptomyces sp. URMC 123]|uniref:winged helix-turn-helix domain-containing protein n=1 Tax=Streptomyces sp. URMC 123 TaxID=3423403 RepID=UPI003F1D1D2A